MRQTEVRWIATKDEMPTTEEFGPYPYVLVAMACKGKPDWGHQVRWAELRFFGGDKTRPYWASNKSDGCKPIENDSWFVEYWAPAFAHPVVPSVPNVELTGSRAALLPVSPATEGSEVERRVGPLGETP